MTHRHDPPSHPLPPGPGQRKLPRQQSRDLPAKPPRREVPAPTPAASPPATGPDAAERITAGSILGPDASLADALDQLLDRGVAALGEVTLGLADVDLVHLRLAAVLGAADRLERRLPPTGGARGAAAPPSPGPAPSPEHKGAAGNPAAAAAATRTAFREAAPPSPAATAPQAAGAAEEATAMPEGAGGLPGERAEEGPPPTSASGFAEPSAEAASDPAFRHRDLEAGDANALSPGASSVPARRHDPEEVRRSVARLVLSVVELLRRLMEHQAIRRMEEETLTDDEVERLGQALQVLEQTLHDMAERFDLSPEELNLDLGPLGRLV